MKTIASVISHFCLSTILILGGCGGGGSTATPAPTKATVKLSTQGTLQPGTALKGMSVAIRLPAGVTVDTDANGAVLAGVVTVSGTAALGASSMLPPSYTPASGTVPATLEFTFGASDFGVGEFATVNFNLGPGSTPPSATDVAITPADQNLRPVTTLLVALAVELK